jgi:hypothetical protein
MAVGNWENFRNVEEFLGGRRDWENMCVGLGEMLVFFT